MYIATLLSPQLSQAAKRYWVGTGSNKNWNTTSNWSSTSGGGSGASVPGSSDTVYFNGGGTGQCILNANMNVKRLEMNSGFTDSLKQGSYTVTMGTGGWSLNAGSFIGGSGAITSSGTFSLTGSNFMSTSGIFTQSANFTYTSGSFSHNYGELKMSGTAVTMSGSITLYKFTTISTTSITLSSGTILTVSNLLGLNSTPINGGDIYVTGNISQSGSNTTGGGSTTITINGTGNQYFYGQTTSARNSHGWAPNITINKSSDTLFLKDWIVVRGNWRYTAGIVNVTKYPSTVCFPVGATGNNTIYGNQQFDNLIILGTGGSPNTVAVNSGDTLTVNHDINYGGNTALLLNGIVYCKGNLTNSNTYNSTSAGGTGTIVFSKTGDQHIYGYSTDVTTKLPSILVIKPSGKLYLHDFVKSSGDFLISQGSVDGTTYSATLHMFNQSGSRSISGKFSITNLSLQSSNGSYPFSLGTSDTITVTGTYTTEGTASWLSVNNGVINALGDVYLNNTSTSSNGGGSTTLLFSGSANQTLNGSTTYLSGRLGSVKINKTGGILTLKNNVSLGSGSDWKLISGNIDASTYTSTFIVPVGTHTIQGNQTFYNLSFEGENSTCTSNLTTTDTLTVNGLLKLGGTTGTITLNGGCYNAKGDITVTNSSSGMTTATGSIQISGTGNQTLTGSGVSGGGRLCNIKINKASGTLTMSSLITVAGNWTYVNGSVNPGTSTVLTYPAYNSSTVTTKNGSQYMSFNNFTALGNGTTVVGSQLITNKNLTIGTGATLDGNSKTIYIGGDWTNTGSFTYTGTTVVFGGSSSLGAPYQKVIKASGTVTFAKLKVDKPDGKLYLTSPTIVTDKLYMKKGIMVSTATNLLSISSTGSCDSTYTGSDTSYIAGPLKKIGNTVFTFPLGDTALATGQYHPLSITAPVIFTDAFTAQYFATGQGYGSTFDTDSLESISNCEYWDLTRNVGSSTVIPTLGWNVNSCNVDSYTDLRAAYFDSGTSKWKSMGYGGISANNNVGALKAGFGINGSPLHFLIGSTPGKTLRPYAILKRELDAGYYLVKDGNLKFKFDEEYNDLNDKMSFKIYNDQHTLVSNSATIPSTAIPLILTSDFGENFKTLNLLHCSISSSGSLPNGYYILEVENEKHEKWYLRFKHVNSVSIMCSTGGL